MDSFTKHITHTEKKFSVQLLGVFWWSYKSFQFTDSNFLYLLNYDVSPVIFFTVLLLRLVFILLLQLF